MRSKLKVRGVQKESYKPWFLESPLSWALEHLRIEMRDPCVNWSLGPYLSLHPGGRCVDTSEDMSHGVYWRLVRITLSS